MQKIKHSPPNQKCLRALGLGSLILAFYSPLSLAEINTRIESGSPAIAYAEDGGWTGQWAYLCVDDYCGSAELVEGFWQRTVAEQSIISGETYRLQLKVQDNVLSQYISPEYTITADADGISGGGGTTPPPVEPVAPTISASASPSNATVGENVSISATATSEQASIAQLSVQVTAPDNQTVLDETVSQAQGSCSSRLLNRVLIKFFIKRLTTKERLVSSLIRCTLEMPFLAVTASSFKKSPSVTESDMNSQGMTSITLMLNTGKDVSDLSYWRTIHCQAPAT